MSVKRGLLLLVLAFALAPFSALADTLDFSIIVANSNAAGGSISYAGGGAALVGTKIVVDSVTDVTTGVTFDFGDGPTTLCSPIGPGCVATGPGLLNFMTGANTGGWNFGAGGFISITAPCIDSDLDDAGNCFDDTQASGGLGANTFLRGAINGASVQVSGGTFHVAIVLASDQKDGNLLSLFGITPPAGWNAGGNVSFGTAGSVNTGDAFTSSTLFSGDLVN